MILTIVTFLAVLIILVLAHEMGHYITARAKGVKILEFGLGFPPRIYGIKRGETIYSINLLPLGGFVKLAGEEDPNVPGSLASKSAGSRLLVLSSGALVNLLLPIIFFSLAAMIPHNVLLEPVVIARVEPNSPAYYAGFKAKDTILSFNGRPVENTNDLRRYIRLNLGNQVNIVVRDSSGVNRSLRVAPKWNPPQGQELMGIALLEPVVVAEVAPGSPAAIAGFRAGDTVLSADGTKLENLADLQSYTRLNLGKEITVVVKGTDAAERTLKVTPRSNPPAGQGAMGIRLSNFDANPNIVRRTEPFWRAIPAGMRECIDAFVLFKNEIITWFVGTGAPQVVGPVGMAEMTGEVIRSGFSNLLEWAAFISINLGIVNLLPIPAVDGGRIAFVFLELVRRGKRVAPRTEGLIHLIGFFLLIGLMLLVTYRDIINIVVSGSAIP